MKGDRVMNNRFFQNFCRTLNPGSEPYYQQVAFKCWETLKDIPDHELEAFGKEYIDYVVKAFSDMGEPAYRNKYKCGLNEVYSIIFTKASTKGDFFNISLHGCNIDSKVLRTVCIPNSHFIYAVVLPTTHDDTVKLILEKKQFAGLSEVECLQRMENVFGKNFISCYIDNIGVNVTFKYEQPKN